MPQSVEKLRATVTELERELGELDSLDPEGRRLLEEALAGIQAALGKAPGAMESHSLRKDLQSAMRRFETSHPTLTGLLSRIVDALGQIGI